MGADGGRAAIAALAFGFGLAAGVQRDGAWWRAPGLRQLDGEPPAASAVRWPPAACADVPTWRPAAVRATASRGKEMEDSVAGALSLLCAGDPAYRALWALGARLLGERDLAAFVGRTRAMEAALAGRRTQIWHDALDREALASVSPAKRQRWGLNVACQNLTEEDWVIDLGGHLGETAIDAQLRAPRARVLSVEPSPWNYLLMRLNALQNLPDGHGFVAVRAGIGEGPGRLSGLHPFERSWWSAEGATPAGSVGTFNASIISLSALFKALRVSEVALLKLNCLGCEWDAVLQLWKDGLWSKVRRVVGMLNPSGPNPNLVPGRPVDVRQHVPAHFQLAEARLVFRLLCEASNSAVSTCSHPKLAPLAS